MDDAQVIHPASSLSPLTGAILETTASTPRKTDWLLGRQAASLTHNERSRKLKLRLFVLAVVTACALLTVFAGIMALASG